jgi:hypothetical protein
MIPFLRSCRKPASDRPPPALNVPAQYTVTAQRPPQRPTSPTNTAPPVPSPEPRPAHSTRHTPHQKPPNHSDRTPPPEDQQPKKYNSSISSHTSLQRRIRVPVWRNVLLDVGQADSWATPSYNGPFRCCREWPIVVPEPVTHRPPIHVHQHRSPTPTRRPMAAR